MQAFNICHLEYGYILHTHSIWTLSTVQGVLMSSWEPNYGLLISLRCSQLSAYHWTYWLALKSYCVCLTYDQIQNTTTHHYTMQIKALCESYTKHHRGGVSRVQRLKSFHLFHLMLLRCWSHHSLYILQVCSALLRGSVQHLSVLNVSKSVFPHRWEPTWIVPAMRKEIISWAVVSQVCLSKCYWKLDIDVMM